MRFSEKVEIYLADAPQMVEAVIYEHTHDMGEYPDLVASAVVKAVKKRLLERDAECPPDMLE